MANLNMRFLETLVAEYQQVKVEFDQLVMEFKVFESTIFALQQSLYGQSLKLIGRLSDHFYMAGLITTSKFQLIDYFNKKGQAV